MKIVIRTIVILLFAVYGLKSQAAINIGLKGGLNLNNISQNYRDSDNETETKMKPGFHLGPVFDFEFSEAISLQTGLLFTNKGFSVDLEDGLSDNESVDGFARTSYNYLEVPLNFVYKINNFQLYAGPYFAIGLGGKSKWDYTLKGSGPDMSEVGDRKLKAIFGSIGEGDLDPDERAYKAMDTGLNFGIGYKLGPVLVNAGYSLGLGNLQPDIENIDFDPKDFKSSNRVICISASFYFGQ